MARLRTKYRHGATDVLAHDTGTVPPVPDEAGATTASDVGAVAPATSPDHSATASFREQIEAMQSAEAAAREAARLERMRERIDAIPPSEVDGAIDAARDKSISLDRDTAPDSELADNVEPLEVRLSKMGIPPLAVNWLMAHPQYLFEPDKNAKIQALHHQLLSEGFEGYGQSYFLEMDRRLNGAGAVPDMDVSADLDELDARDAVDRALADARGRARPSIADIEPVRLRHPPVSAPPSRETPSWTNGTPSSRSTRITLSAQQKEAARIAGISEIEYAQNLRRLMEEKQNGHYGGQP